MSSFSSGSSAFVDIDNNQGANAFLGRLNTATNAAGLAVPVVAGIAYSGMTVGNRSATQYIKAVYTFVNGNAVGDAVMLIPPASTRSASFAGSVISGVVFQVVDIPAIGNMIDADALVLGTAFPGTVDFDVNLVNS